MENTFKAGYKQVGNGGYRNRQRYVRHAHP